MIPTTTILDYALRLVATAATVQVHGLTDDLREQLGALVQEAQDSILEPREDGTPWTVEALLAEKARHDALTAAIRDRHTGDGTGQR